MPNLNERVTENIVENHFKNDILMVSNEVLFEYQKSKYHKSLFAKASKNKKENNGYPEFLISFNKHKNFLIIVECKADINKHETKTQDSPKDYAVDGILHYISCIVKENSDLDVLGIAISGMNEDELQVSNFLYKKNKLRKLQDNKLLDFNSYLKIYQLDKYIIDLQNLKITEKAIEYNYLLHTYDIPETERATFISAILLALQNDGFREGYKNYFDIIELVNYIILSCENVLKKNNIDSSRANSIIRVYSSIKNHRITTTKTIKNKSTKKNEPNTIIKDFITNIKKDIYPLVNLDNKGFDILGKFYTEFIKYAGSDSKTGLVLTPSHITDLFCSLIDLNIDDVVYDCCCGTGGFLVASMKRMTEKAENDRMKIKYIKGNISLITATSENNGVIEFLDYNTFRDSKKIFKDKITIDMFFNVFYHKEKYFSDDNVHTLIPKFNNGNKYIYLFLVSSLKQLQYKYAYGRQVRLSRLNYDTIKLPADKQGNPDWQFMEDYIKSLPYSSNI